jgi:hypothetical protein
MPAGKSQLDRLRKRFHPLRDRMEIFISGRAPSDPLYLTNRTWRQKLQQKLKIALLIAAPVLLLIGLVTIGATTRLRRDKVDPNENSSTEAPPPSDASPPAVPRRPSSDPILASTDLEVVNIRIARDAHPPAVTGLVRNKTGRRVASAEVSYYLADTAGSVVGTDTTQVANVEPHGSVAFRMALKIAGAQYVFVRDVHPN